MTLPTDRVAALETIAAEVRGCTLCPLHQTRTHAVPGAGSYEAQIVFVGEGPGQHEDERGLPFVGRSGEYLNYLLSLIDLRRPSVFITNVVKCRPPANRDPEPLELNTCRPYLDQQIALIAPLVVVTLGRYSMARYFPDAKISAIHGQPRYTDDCAYYPLYHPAAALRNPSLRRDMEDDIRRLPDVLQQVQRLRRGEAAPPPAPAPLPSPPPATPAGGQPSDDAPSGGQLSLF